MSVMGGFVKARNTNTVDGAEEEVPSGGESEWLERGDHPLLNDLILDSLFGFVRRSDLKACRVVCKKWNLHTIPHMRLNFETFINLNQSPPWKEEDVRMGDFVKLFKSNELGIPITSFALFPFCTRDEVGQQFLQLCGESATDIDMNLPRAIDAVYTIEDVSELLRSCPNLKVLGFPYNLMSRSGSVVKLFPDSEPFPTFSSLKKITFGTLSAPNRKKDCPSAIEELLTAAPNVSEIVVFDIYKAYTEPENCDDNIGVVLNCIEKLGRESSIQSLDLRQATTPHLEQLRRMAEKENGLKLRSLTFETNVDDDDFEDYYQPIQIQLATMFKDSLQSLSVNFMEESDLTRFPYMPLLESLVDLFASGNFDSKPVDLNKNFPVLQTLELNFFSGNEDNVITLLSYLRFHDDSDKEDEDEEDAVLFSKFDPCPTIKSLRVRGHSIMTIHVFHNIRRVFPNVTKLDLQVRDDGDEILRQIWTHITSLKSLTIEGSIERMYELEMDSVFTGIPIGTLEEIRHIGNELEKMTTQERTGTIQKLIDQHSTLPSIRNLTNLRDLNLTLTGGFSLRSEGLIYLTDLTAYLAFHSMHHLRHLDVNRFEFSKTCCEILKKDLELESWRFRNTEYKRTIISPFLPN